MTWCHIKGCDSLPDAHSAKNNNNSTTHNDRYNMLLLVLHIAYSLHLGQSRGLRPSCTSFSASDDYTSEADGTLQDGNILLSQQQVAAVLQVFESSFLNDHEFCADIHEQCECRPSTNSKVVAFLSRVSDTDESIFPNTASVLLHLVGIQ
jgi:hypothetical protein